MELQKLLLSQDGSHTIYSDKYKAHYHSVYGAIDESIHVFISAGLYYKYRQGHRQVTIFEMGLGTGLNAYLTYLEAKKLGISVHYISVETDPVSTQYAAELNYHSLLGESDNSTFLKLHSSDWEKPIEINQSFIFEKHHTDLQSMNTHHSVDLIYYDAFAPSCQPELWKIPVHQKLYSLLKSSGILVTYCAQGQFKRNLKSVGYTLELLNGPHKKREMVRGIKA